MSVTSQTNITTQIKPTLSISKSFQDPATSLSSIFPVILTPIDGNLIAIKISILKTVSYLN